MPLTVGTAGHVDHGKTWLVRALTGKDTDRLPEEKSRGISIDLGYAPLDLGDGRRLSLVDVPGHERFVRNMVAGATGIDLFLLVIDAREGARPQTGEHLAILRLLGVTSGVVAVTKSDTVDDETLELAREEARELVPGAAVVAVSAKTGAGLDELRHALATAADQARPQRPDAPTRLFVDRVFSLRGIGTVATGTLWSGSIGDGDELRAEPAGVPVRVRSVQVHDQPVARAQAGQRVAVALPGTDRGRLRRGDALVERLSYPVSYRLDVALEELTPLRDGMRLQVHHGTTETSARVRRAGSYAQLRLEAPVVAARGDRVILRAGTTLGGARVLDPSPRRKLEVTKLRRLEQGDAVEIVRAIVREPVTAGSLAARGLLAPPELARGLAALQRSGDWYFAPAWLDEIRAATSRKLRARAKAEPLDPGLAIAELLPRRPWASAISGLLGVERRGGKAYLPGMVANIGNRSDDAGRLEQELSRTGADTLRIEDRQLAGYLEQTGKLVRLGDGFAVGTAGYDLARDVVRAECERAGSIRLARLRDLLGISRRSAQLLLERLDQDGVTRRIGDERVLRRRGTSSQPAE